MTPKTTLGMAGRITTLTSNDRASRNSQQPKAGNLSAGFLVSPFPLPEFQLDFLSSQAPHPTGQHQTT